MKNKAAQQLAKKSAAVQKKRYGKDYGAEMKRRVEERWKKAKVENQKRV